MKFFNFILFVLFVILSLGATCQNQTKMSRDSQNMINSEFKGRRFFLNSSMYYGNFYGNSDICLLTLRRFRETNYLEGIDNRPIFPGEEKGIIPFNSEVLIEKIEFPYSNRPLLTPRFYPWVYLKVDRLEGYRTCIVVIRPDVSKVEEFEILFYEIFSRDSREDRLKEFSSEVRDAIFNKRYIDGLNEEEVYIIFGRPDNIEHRREGGEKVVIFDYEYFKITFKNDKTVSLTRTEKR